MSRPPPPNPYARAVDRKVFERNFRAAIEPMTTPELRDFLKRCQTDNSGTEGEEVIIQLIEAELARRAAALN